MNILKNFLLNSILTFLITIIILSSNCVAERLLGEDLLALYQKNFDYKKASSYVTSNEALGVLDFTFGPEEPSLPYILNNSNPRILRVHLIDTVCVRNQNCGRYSVVFGYTIASLNKALEKGAPKILSHIRERTDLYRKYAANFPTKIIISPFLEHNLTLKAWRAGANAVKEVWPEAQLDNSGMAGVAVERYLGAWLEGHGSGCRSNYDICSLDGTDITDIKVSDWLKNTTGNKITFKWTRSYNCRNQGPFQDPRKRNSCPSNSTFELLDHITDPLPVPPRYSGTKCKKIKPMKSPSILKPLAEDKGKPDPRKNLPVFISDMNAGNITLVASNDTQVGIFGYYGLFENGPMERYYSNWKAGTGLGGYDYQKIAVEKSGSPYVWALKGSQCIGPFVTGQRQGAIR